MASSAGPVALPTATAVQSRQQQLHGEDSPSVEFQKSSSFPLPNPSSHSSSSSAYSSSAPPKSFQSHFPTLPRPAPLVDTAPALKLLCQQSSLLLSTLTPPSVLEQIDAIEQQIHSSLARLDEYSALVDAVSAPHHSRRAEAC